METKPTNEAFDRFCDFAKKVVCVPPKAVIDRREKEYQKSRSCRRTAGGLTERGRKASLAS